MPDTLVAQRPPYPQSHIRCALQRNTLGLAIHLALDVHRTPPDLPPYTDATFTCSPHNLTQLIDHLINNRPDLARPLYSGETLTIFIPQTDPPIIRVSRRIGRSAYFNLGELWRWRFLTQLPDYPFKTHQRTGVTWLRGRPYAVLADDMGLGKTLQAIAALVAMHKSRDILNALVICPKSLIGVWEAELSLWAPRLCVVALHSTVPLQEWSLIATQSHVAITNYDAIRRSHPHAGAFDLVIFDEIHKLKNPRSRNYAAAYNLRPRFAWGLSGTPLENHAGDLAAILHLLDRKHISHSDRRLPPRTLRSLASTYILRRSRSVISGELPELVEKTEFVPLLPEQEAKYNRIRRNHPTGTLGAWIASFNRLRDVCDLDEETLKSSKVDRALAIIAAVKVLGEKAVVFSWRIQPLQLLHARLAAQHGGSAVAIITGQTDSTSRSTIVNHFQSQRAPFVLLCSTRATAEGLTLTAANHVVFLNDWWNPAVNVQARDRVNRIGQTRNVYVYRLRTQGTIESRLDELLQRKSVLFDEIVRRLTEPNAHASRPVPAHLSRFLDTE